MAPQWLSTGAALPESLTQSELFAYEKGRLHPTLLKTIPGRRTGAPGTVFAGRY